MTLAGRAWRYVTRKHIRTLLLFIIITAVVTVLVSAGAVKTASAAAGRDAERTLGSGFVLENSPYNSGTPRGGGTVKPADVERIAALPGVDCFTARQDVTADLVGAKVARLDRQEYDAKREAQLGNAVSVRGVSASADETNIRSGTLELVAGRHITREDKNKAIIHEDLARLNGLTVGSKLTLRGNPYDYDNTKKSTAEVTVEIVGLVRGDNPQPAARRLELFANAVYTDLATTRALYAYTPETEIYQDTTFFVTEGADSETVMNEARGLPIDWRNYQLTRTSQLLTGITGAVAGVQSVMTGAIITTALLALALLSLVLVLWLRERRRETGVLLAIGTSKLKILGQYLVELLFISIPAAAAGVALSTVVAQRVGTSVLASVKKSGMEELTSQAPLGGGVDVTTATRTLDDLTVQLSAGTTTLALALTLAVLIGATVLAALPMLRTSPRKLLVSAA
ncbi:ABC transporter permease [Actinotignum sp. GS-2025f]|uniref:ABC transporter permease n=1 Tax=Actinotignum sp. GS-2025f TaxID=3427279 RepID=UPI003F4600C7